VVVKQELYNAYALQAEGRERYRFLKLHVVN